MLPFLMLKLVQSFHSTDKKLRKYFEVMQNIFSGNNKKRIDTCTNLMLRAHLMLT